MAEFESEGMNRRRDDRRGPSEETRMSGNRGNGNIADGDKQMALIARILACTRPTPINEVIAATQCARATVYRVVNRMQKHFPLEYVRGNNWQPGRIHMRHAIGGRRYQ
jgi:hypothetical protein